MDTKLTIWLLAAMRAWVPVAGGGEREATEARYASIAADAAATAEAEEPLFKGEHGVAKTALLLVSVARYESNFLASVDEGRKRGDGGKSWCLTQVLFPGDDAHRSLVVEDGKYRWSHDAAEGWTGKDLVDDRRKCFAAALAIARDSYRACGNLSGYTSGHCSRTEKKALIREGLAKAWFKGHAPPVPEPAPEPTAMLW